MRQRIWIAMLLVFALLTAACNATPKRSLPESTPVPTPTPGPVEEVTIKLYQMAPDNPGEPMLDVLVAGFTQQYPQFKVERVILPGEGDPREVVKGMLDGQVDVVPVDYWEESLTSASLPLDTYILKSGVDLDAYGPGFAGHRVDGKTHYLPYALIPIGIMANADLLKKAGVTLPQGTWTWDEFRALASQLTRREAPQTWGFVDMPLEEVVRIYLEGQGDRPAWEATDKELQEALQFFGTMVRLDQSVQPLTIRQWQLNTRDPLPDMQPVIDGKIAMWPSVYVEGVAEALGLPFETEWALIPTHVGRKPASLGHIRAFAVSGGSKVPDAAWEFVRYATGPDGAKALAAGGVLPMYLTDEVQKAWFARTPAPPPFTEAFFKTNWYFYQEEDWRMGLGGPEFLLVLDLNRMAGRVLTQGMDASQAVKLFREESAVSIKRAAGR
ncbi:MAG: sugar transporter substrate-binding protein [Symbiobacteriaceae bacterium]|jgi:multiple sugar transport system substrate-binding protein|nr:sugar transporter substrate-binding protein [Symbiobacteriaceae bacterium]